MKKQNLFLGLLTIILTLFVVSVNHAWFTAEDTQAATGDATTVAGTGVPGLSGDGSSALTAQMANPGYVAAHPNSGEFYISFTGVANRIRKVDASGTITTYAGTGGVGFGGDGGPASSALLAGPRGMAVDGVGNLYIADSGNNRIRKVNCSTCPSPGQINTIAGTGVPGFADGLALSAQFNQPFDIDIDAAGNLYIADRVNSRIRKIDTGGNVTTIAGTGVGGFNFDGIPATTAQINNPHGVAVNAAGTLVYVADTFNQRVREVVVGGNISTIAGTGVGGFNGDGILGSTAQVKNPIDVAVDSAGDVYIGDQDNNRVRKVDVVTGPGNISTFAGTGTACSPVGDPCGDGGPATSAKLGLPNGVDFNGSDNLFIAEFANHKVRRVQGVEMNVLSISPLNNAIDISQSSAITIVFDKSLNTTSVTSSNLRVQGNKSGNIAGGFAFSTTTFANDTVTFTPSSNYVVGETVTVSVTDGVIATDASFTDTFVSTFFVEVPTVGGSLQAQLPISLPNGFSSGGYGKVLGDFNNDGNLDLVTSRLGPDAFEEVRIFSGDGLGGFTSQTSFPYPFNSRAKGIVTSDFDNDGNLDFAVLGINTGTTADVFFGDGLFGFTQVSVGVVSGGRDGLISDFDGDGDIDISYHLVSTPANYLTSLNNGDGTFATPTFNSLLTGNNEFPAGGDFNNDNIPDLIAASNTSNSLSLLLGVGDGTFAAATSVTTASNNNGIGVSDFDGDGNLDVAVTTIILGTRTLEILLGDGLGGFASGGTFALSPGVSLITLKVADFDADGDTDAFISDVSNNELDVILNDGSGNFSTSVSFPLALGAGSVFKFTLGDINNDGRLDVLFTNKKGVVDEIIPFLNFPICGNNILESPEQCDDGAVVDGDGCSSTCFDEPTLSFTFGTSGTGAGQMDTPQDVLFGSSILVADTINHRVQKFDTSGTFLFEFGSNGTGDGQFNRPVGLARDSLGNIYVIDSLNHRVQKFDSTGSFLGCLAGGVAGFQTPCLTFGFGTANGQFNTPSYLTIDNADNIFVSDGNNHRVQKFDSAGNFLLKFGGLGFGDGKFSNSGGIVIDSSANIIVADRNNSRIQKFDSTGNFVGCLGGGVQAYQNPCLSFANGTLPVQFGSPRGLAIDASDNLLVANQTNNRFDSIDSTGKHRFFESAGLNSPFGISSGSIFVVDTLNDRIVVYDASANCGNGLVEQGEGCDDSGTTPGDGCDATCAVEFGFNCVGEPSVCALPNVAPAATVPTLIAQATDGSGHISFQTTLSDGDPDPTRLQVEYSDDGGGNFFDAELVSAVPDSGTVNLNNADTYQVGTADAIDTDLANVTVTVIWNSSSVSNGNGPVLGEQSDIQVRVTPNDSTVDGATQTTTNFTIDNLAPIGLTALSSGTSSTTSQPLSWSAVIENNFNHYEIWFGTNLADVISRSGTAMEWDNGDDLNLGNIATITTTITGLTPTTVYFYKIFAVDDFGNEETVSDITSSTGGVTSGQTIPAPPAVEDPTEEDLMEEELSQEMGEEGEEGEVRGEVHTAAGQTLDKILALDFLSLLDLLFGWRRPLDAQITGETLKFVERYQEVFHLKSTLQIIGEFSGFNRHFEYQKPEIAKIENVAQLTKSLMLSFNGCYTLEEFDWVLTHDLIYNQFWWAGYRFFLTPLLEQIYGPEYLLSDSISELDMLNILMMYLKEHCGMIHLDV